jgi:hypothetical protein
MAKSPSTKEIELHPDAWQRFERAAGVVAKSPPQHRSSMKPKPHSEKKIGSARASKKARKKPAKVSGS